MSPTTISRWTLIAVTSLFCLAAPWPALGSGEPSESGSSRFLNRDFLVETADGVLIRGTLYSGNNDRVIVYCHRLLRGKGGAEVDRLLKAFRDRYDLISFDFRGHKSSLGLTTSGGTEILDLRAVVGFALTQGYRHLAVLGAGMGGTVGLRTADIFGDIDALVVVSPSGFSPALSPFLVRLVTDKTLGTTYGKLPLRIVTRTRLGVRYSAGYPADMLPSTGSAPTLVLQAKKDRFTKLEQVQLVLEDVSGLEHLLILPGRKHAEDLIDDETIARVAVFLDSLFVEDTAVGSNLGSEPTAGDSQAWPITLTGDVPLPEAIILKELEGRLSAAEVADSAGCYRRTDILRELREVLAFHGYTRARLTAVDSPPGLAVEISLPTIASVSISGNRWVEEAYIRSRLCLGRGYFNAYQLDEAIRRVAAEPAVRTVRSSLSEHADSTLDVQISVFEERSYRFILATKYTDIDDYVGIGFKWNEFNPTGFQYHGEAMLGIKDYDMLTSHSLSKNLLTTRLRIGGAYFDVIKSRDDLDYVFSRQEVHEVGGEIRARYEISSSVAVELATFGKSYKKPVVTAGMAVDEGTAGGIHLRLDLKGRLPLHRVPRFEWRHTFYWQRAGPWGIGDFDFGAYQLNFWGDLRLFRHHRIRTALHGGWIRKTAPLQERFSLGGMTTLPGYPDDSFVGTRFALAAQSLYLSAASLVPETSVWHSLGFQIYFHAGTVWESGQKFDTDTLRMDAGFEFDYLETLRAGMVWPVGPLREGSPRAYIGWGLHVL